MAQKNQNIYTARHDINYYNFIKRNAQNISIGITNHAHLIHSDVENSIYELFDDCIVDEAHHFSTRLCLPKNRMTNQVVMLILNISLV